MTHRERLHAALHYQPYDALPVVHFGFLSDTMNKWADEGHITREEARGWADSNPPTCRSRPSWGSTSTTTRSSLRRRTSCRTSRAK